MATVTIRNLSDKTREAIRVKAALNKRSMEAELRDLIERTYGEPERLPMEEVRRRIQALSGGGRLKVCSVDEFLADLAEVGRGAGLSLADRACLCLAMRLGGTAVTADRAWTRIADHVSCDIRLIR